MPPPPPAPDGERERTQPFKYGGWGLEVLPRLLWGMFSSVLTLVLISVLLCCAGPDKCWSGCRPLVALVLVLIWLSVASLLTFRPPFTYTGNGFFACWCGVLQSVHVLYRELIPNHTSYEVVAKANAV